MPVSLSGLTIASHSHATSLLFHRGPTYTFDPSGRLISIYTEGRFFARALDGTMKEKSWTGSVDEFDRRIEPVADATKFQLFQDLRQSLAEARDWVARGEPTKTIFPENPVPKDQEKDHALVLLNRIQYRTVRELAQEESDYHSIYTPINILPPDQYFTIVIQVAEGCPWNKCTFCNFYQHRQFRIKSFAEIQRQMSATAAFLKEGVRLRRSVFFSDANAFCVPTDQMLMVLKEAARLFPEQMEKEGGGYTFGDVPAILGKSDDELKRLSEAGLRRVYVGVESGSDTVRTFIHKPGKSADVVRAARKLKDAGIEVGAIFLLGVGGAEYEKFHVRDSVSLIEKMKLDERDILFFSPFYPHPVSEYSGMALTKGITTLTKNQLRRQYAKIKEGILAKTPMVKLGIYDIREFIY